MTAESVSRPKAIKVPTATATLVETKTSPSASSVKKPEKARTKRKRGLSEDDMRALVRELLNKKA